MPDRNRHGPVRTTIRSATRQRGVAMVLVLIAVIVTVVLGGTVLTARQNSTAIGDNAGSAAVASWSAESAAQYTVAVLQTEADWLSTGGDLMTDVPFLGGDVTVTITAIDGSDPSDEDRELIITATAVVDGVDTTVQKLVSVTPSGGVGDVDPHLGEFGVFGRTGVDIDNDAIVSKWSRSPEYGAAAGVKLGTGFVSSADLEIADGARLIGAELYVDDHASSSLEAMTSDVAFAGGTRIPLRIPVVPKALPSAFGLLPDVRAFDLVLVDGAYTLPGVAAIGDLELTHGAELTLDGDGVGSHYSFSDAVIEDSTLIINGSVSLWIRDDLEIIDGSSVVLEPGAMLAIYVADSIAIVDSVVGVDADLAGTLDRSATDVSEYVDPRRIRIFGLSEDDGGASSATILIREKSLVVGFIHAPLAEVGIESSSTLFGRVSADVVRIGESCRLLYCPRMDTRIGFTSLRGPLYNDDGTPITGLITALNTFDESLGADQLGSHLESSIGSSEESSEGGNIVETVTPRSARRAVERPIPLNAAILELMSWDPNDDGTPDVMDLPNDTQTSFIHLGSWGLGGASLSKLLHDPLGALGGSEPVEAPESGSFDDD